MSFVGKRVEHILDAVAQARKFLLAKAHPGGDGICSTEADAPYIVREVIRFSLYDLYVVVAKGLNILVAWCLLRSDACFIIGTSDL